MGECMRPDCYVNTPHEHAWDEVAALCAELDQYYGTDEYEAHRCSPCRLGRRAK